MKKLLLCALGLLAFAVLILPFGFTSRAVKAAHDDNQNECLTRTVIASQIKQQAEDTPPTGNWVLYNRTGSTGSGALVTNTSGGTGDESFQLSTPGANDKVTLSNFDLTGQSLSGLSSLAYSTFRAAGTGQQLPSLQIAIDKNGGTLQPGDFSTLVFEPVYNTAQGAVVNNMWQTWVAGPNSTFWSTRPIGDQCAGAVAGCFETLSYILAHNPQATILGIGINQGSGNAGLTTLVDNLKVVTMNSCVTYTFEATVGPEQANECKHSGWQTMTQADGTTGFRNQGQCVSYFKRLGGEDIDDDDDDDDDNASPTPTPVTTPTPTVSPTPTPTPTPTASPSPTPKVGPPTDKDQCKDGGWRRFNTPRAFSSQSDCINFVNQNHGHGHDDDDDDGE